MNPDSYSITYLTGAGMMVDLAAWILIGLGMLATSFSIGLLLAVARKRRIERNAAAELQMNWFAQIKPTDPAFSVPVLGKDRLSFEPKTIACGKCKVQTIVAMHVPRPFGVQVCPDCFNVSLKEAEQPAAPACGVAQSCNACSECPDLERK